MPLPPPPGPAEFSEVLSWLFFVLAIGTVAAVIALLAKYLLGIMTKQSQYTGPIYGQEYDELLRELIEEIRLLRKDIDKLRRELRE